MGGTDDPNKGVQTSAVGWREPQGFVSRVEAVPKTWEVETS